MDKKFITRFYGNKNSIAIPMIAAFGEMRFYDPAEDPANFTVLILEGGFEPCITDPGLLTALFKSGKTIAFLNSTQKQLDALAACTGRAISLPGKSIFVRQLNIPNERGEKFGYTLIPDYTKERVIDEYRNNKNDIYHQLRDEFFQELTTAPVYHTPNPATIQLYPISNDFSALHGSWANLYNAASSLPIDQSPGRVTPPAVTFNLKVDSYAFLANGSGGDGNYHLMLHSLLTAFSPVSLYVDNTNSVVFTTAYRYQYQLGVTLNNHNGRKFNVQPTVPDDNASSSSNTYGYNIFTNFPPPSLQKKIISLMGRDGNGSPIPIQFSPVYQWMINQVDFLSIQNYFTQNEDAAATSQVWFNNRDANIYDSTPGTFEMMSYFIVDAVAGETTCPVQLEFTLSVTIQYYTQVNGGWLTAWGANFPITTLDVDLAQRTKEQKYNPPPAGS